MQAIMAIILADIEKAHQAGWHEGRQYQVDYGTAAQPQHSETYDPDANDGYRPPKPQPPDTDDRVKEQGQWTRETVRNLWREQGSNADQLCGEQELAKAFGPNDRCLQIGGLAFNVNIPATLIADRINAAIADEREKLRDKLRKEWSETNRMLLRKLIEAQAAIAGVNHYCEHYSDNSESPVGVLVISNIEALLSTADLSALDKHDAEVEQRVLAKACSMISERNERDANLISQVRKPLVDALDELLDTSADTTPGVFPTEAHLQARRKAVKLLAKVKEGK
jgi:hypothetical protein